MSLSLLQSIAVAVLLLSGGVFVLAYRFALREAVSGDQHQMLPRARVHGGRPGRRLRGGPVLLSHHVHVLQAGLVAFGITAVFFMLVCMAGIILAMVAA